MPINRRFSNVSPAPWKSTPASTQGVTRPMACPSCGSTHFIQASAEEFSNNGYGSAEFRSLTAGFQPLSVFICLCGTPMPVKGMSEFNYRDNPKGRYLMSLQKAITHGKGNRPQALTQGCVSLAEYEELRDQVAIQQNQIDGLLDAIEALQRANGDDADEKHVKRNATQQSLQPGHRAGRV